MRFRTRLRREVVDVVKLESTANDARVKAKMFTTLSHCRVEELPPWVISYTCVWVAMRGATTIWLGRGTGNEDSD
jgi:hypothetical protein